MTPKGVEPGAVATVQVHDRLLCEVLLPADAEPDHRCRAQVYGYAAQPVDAFAVAICALVMLNGSPPWQQAHLGDATFAYAHRHGLWALLRQWGMSPPSASAEEMIDGLVCADPAQR